MSLAVAMAHGRWPVFVSCGRAGTLRTSFRVV